MRRFKNVLVTAFILIIFIFIASDNYQKLLPFFKSEIKLARHTFFADSEEKLVAHHGKEVLNYIRAAVNATPTNAQIMIPPQQEPWPIIGNREFMQYFFYPRKLIHENLDKVEADSNLTHILITWGESAGFNPQIRGWPKFFVPVRRIYFPPRETQLEVFNIEVKFTGRNFKILEPEAERGLKPLSKLINLSSDLKKEKVTQGISEVKSALVETLTATYTSAGFDYWGIATQFPLTSTTKIQAKILTNLPNSVTLVAKVDYAKDFSAVFSSRSNQSLDQEVLKIDNLYTQAVNFGKNLGIPTSNITLAFIGFDLGHQADFPYLEKWGVAELEKGDLNVIDLSIHNSFYYTQLATKEFVLGNYNTAVENISRAILLDENKVWPKTILAQIYFKSKNLEKAKEIHQEIVKVNLNAWSYFQLGQILDSQGNYKLALANFTKAVEAAPEPSWINLAIGQSYEKLGNFVNAVQFYRQSAARNAYIFTQSGQKAQQRLNEIILEQNKIISKLQVLLKQSPNDFQANFELANAYFVIGKNEKALEIYKKFSQINPLVEIPEQLERQLISFIDSFESSSFGEIHLDGYRDFIKGTSGLAVDFGVGEYISYKPEILPRDLGTIEFFWRPNKNLFEVGDKEKFATLLYQPGAAGLTNGVFLFAGKDVIVFGIFDANVGKWHFVKTGKIQLSPEKWYQVKISYGPAGIHLVVDGKDFVNPEAKLGIGQNSVFVGSIQGYLKELLLPTGSFDELKFLSFQK